MAQRISDRRILKLIRQWLNAGVMEDGVVRDTFLGTPQGGVISPLLANIYLNYLDETWEEHGKHLGTLIRYADDFVILSRTRREAERAMKGIRLLLGRLKLQLHPEKTKLVCLWDGQEGFDFLGFHFRKVKARTKDWYYPNHWPSRKAERAMRQKVRTVTGNRTALPAQGVGDHAYSGTQPQDPGVGHLLRVRHRLLAVRALGPVHRVAVDRKGHARFDEGRLGRWPQTSRVLYFTE